MINVLLLILLYSAIFWAINKFNLTPKRNTPQTFHKKPTSRMGGAAMFLALSTQIFLLSDHQTEYPNLSMFFMCSIPVFLAGLLDDLFINVSPIQRILLMIPTPIFFFYFAGLKVTAIEVPFFDWLLQYEIFALLFLIFALVGIINAFNIIDGFNALLLSYCLSICISIYLVFPSLDSAVLNYLATMSSALVGLTVLNAFGKIFMGDAGAYLLGALIAAGLIIFQKNQGFSPWYVLMVLIYPVTEVICSFVRKVIFRNKSAMQPDGLHFHMLIYKRISKKIGFRKIRLRHLIVTLFIFVINFPFLIFANLYAKDTFMLMIVCFWYVLVYLSIYLILLPKYIFKK